MYLENCKVKTLNRIRQRSEEKRLPSPHPPPQAAETLAILDLITTTFQPFNNRTLKLSKHFNHVYVHVSVAIYMYMC